MQLVVRVMVVIVMVKKIQVAKKVLVLLLLNVWLGQNGGNL